MIKPLNDLFGQTVFSFKDISGGLCPIEIHFHSMYYINTLFLMLN